MSDNFSSYRHYIQAYSFSQEFRPVVPEIHSRDRQTDRQTQTLIIIRRSFSGDKVITDFKTTQAEPPRRFAPCRLDADDILCLLKL